jgi:vacuolar-type H+-ATPase subunit H
MPTEGPVTIGTMSDQAEPTPLRRSWFGGYRASDVELERARTTLLADRLRHELEGAGQRAKAMQTEIDDLHGRVDALRRRESELSLSLTELREQQETDEREAQTHADKIVAEAQHRAATLRTEGLKELADLQQQVEDLLGLRAKVMQSLSATSDGIRRALGQLPPTEDDDRPADDARPADDLAARLARWTRDEP